MSRRTRRQYNDTQTAVRKPRKTFGEAMAMLKAAIKRKAIELGHIILKPTTYWWEYTVPAPNNSGKRVSGYVKAPTKSEARAELKREMKAKLPPHIQLVRGTDASCR